MKKPRPLSRRKAQTRKKTQALLNLRRRQGPLASRDDVVRLENRPASNWFFLRRDPTQESIGEDQMKRYIDRSFSVLEATDQRMTDHCWIHAALILVFNTKIPLSKNIYHIIKEMLASSPAWSHVAGESENPRTIRGFDTTQFVDFVSSAPATTATALFDYAAKWPGELSFLKGDVLTVTDRFAGRYDDGSAGWIGRLGDKTGLFPSNHVRLNQERLKHGVHPPLFLLNFDKYNVEEEEGVAHYPGTNMGGYDCGLLYAIFAESGYQITGVKLEVWYNHDTNDLATAHIPRFWRGGSRGWCAWGLRRKFQEDAEKMPKKWGKVDWEDENNIDISIQLKRVIEEWHGTTGDHTKNILFIELGIQKSSFLRRSFSPNQVKKWTRENKFIKGGILSIENGDGRHAIAFIKRKNAVFFCNSWGDKCRHIDEFDNDFVKGKKNPYKIREIQFLVYSGFENELLQQERRERAAVEATVKQLVQEGLNNAMTRKANVSRRGGRRKTKKKTSKRWRRRRRRRGRRRLKTHCR